MPDPLLVAKNEKTIEQEEAMDNVVQKALKKRKARKKRAYDKLAMLAPSVSRVLQNTQYGAAAGGFKPSVPTDQNNGWSSTKVTHEKRSGSKDRWPGIYKLANPAPMITGALAAPHGAMLGGGLGAGLGALYGAAAPGEDAKGQQRNRILEALKRGLMGAGIGGLSGATLAGAGGVGFGQGLNNAMSYIGHPSEMPVPDKLKAAIIGSLLGGGAGALTGAGIGAATEEPGEDGAITRGALTGAGAGALLGGGAGISHAIGKGIIPHAMRRYGQRQLGELG